MIPLDFITEWRRQAPWTQDYQVEQDLIICRALVEIYSRTEIARSLSFRGGAALYKLHLPSLARYSEDIDLVQVNAGPIGAALDAIRDALDPWLGTPRRILKDGRVTLAYRMESEGLPPVPMRLKVEINSREHFNVLDMEERPLKVQSRWFNGIAAIKTYPLEELLGTKMRALYQRKKGRDLFDLWYAHLQARVDHNSVVQCFLEYLNQEGLTVSRAEFEANLYKKLADSEFTKDLAPLLAHGIVWDPHEAGRYVFEELAALIPGEPWKGKDQI